MGPLSLSRANPGLVFWSPRKSPHLGKQGEEWLRTSAAPASFSEFTKQKNTKQLGKPAKKLGLFLILSAKNEGWKEVIQRKNRSQQQKCHFNQKQKEINQEKWGLNQE